MDSREAGTTPQIQADANNIPKGSIDCGIKAIGCCNGPGCQKLGTIRNFLIIFSIAGILQGAVESYFRISVQQAAFDYGFDPTIVDWLLVSSFILQSFVSILVAYWAGKFHHMAWLGCLIMLQAIGCFMVIVPTLSHRTTEHSNLEATPVSSLCQTAESMKFINVKEKPYSMDTLVLLFFLQLGTSLGSTSFYTLGFSYIDDNAELIDSPALIGTALAAKFYGPQLGSVVSLAVNATPFTWWLGWTIISPALFISGALLAIFPKRLLNTVIKLAANRIIEVNTLPLRQSTKFIDNIDLWPSLRRLFTNKILIINIIALTFTQAATVNYLRHEQSYLLSRFFLPSNTATGLINEWTSRFLSHLMKPPAVALCVLVAGLIIAKMNPSARSLIAWNIGIGVITCLLYISYIFIKCPEVKIAGTQGNKIMQPYCANACICSPNQNFNPVCPQDSTQTYFSPCHAGCTSDSIINDITIYQNCTCAANSHYPLRGILASEGSCNYNNCQQMWIIFQVLTIFGAALLGTGLVGRIIISLRCILPQDKSLALALELTITCFITYLPAKAGYDFVSYYTCQFTSIDNSKCYLHESPLHGNLLNIISACLIFIAILWDIILFVFVKDLECYRDNDEDSFRSIPLRAMSSNSRYDEINNDPDDAEEIGVSLIPRDDHPVIHSIQSTQGKFGINKREDTNGHLNENNDELDFRMQHIDDNYNISSRSVANQMGPLNTFTNASNDKNTRPSVETDF